MVSNYWFRLSPQVPEVTYPATKKNFIQMFSIYNDALRFCPSGRNERKLWLLLTRIHCMVTLLSSNAVTFLFFVLLFYKHTQWKIDAEWAHYHMLTSATGSTLQFRPRKMFRSDVSLSAHRNKPHICVVLRATWEILSFWIPVIDNWPPPMPVRRLHRRRSAENDALQQKFRTTSWSATW